MALRRTLPPLLYLIALASRGAPVSPLPPQRDRSPVDVVVSRTGRWAISVNATSNSISLCSLETNRVEAEATVGTAPFAAAISPDERFVLVTNRESNDLSVVAISPHSLRTERTISVGDTPRSVAITADGSSAYVALSGEDRIAVVDVHRGAVVDRLPCAREPWDLALAGSGRLAVGCAGSGTVEVFDAPARRRLFSVSVSGHNLRQIALSPDGRTCYVPSISERGKACTVHSIQNGWVVGNRLNRISLDAPAPREALTLDTVNQGAGDLTGDAISPDGQTVVVTSAGTHALYVLRGRLPFMTYGGPPDLMDPADIAEGRIRRVETGGRPGAVRFVAPGQVLVANYLENSIQRVDITTGTVIGSIALGGALTPDVARRGEALFMDAGRSYHGWLSCDTCHTEGATNGALFDTFNDGSFGTPKKTPSLRGVAQTSPWTWHGWQKNLSSLVRSSMVNTMQGPAPTPAQVEAVTDYLKTLDFRPRTVEATDLPAEARGREIFAAERCGTCHTPPAYTSPGIYNVGLEEPRDPYHGFNPPSLRGVYRRAPYLHDGRAFTLEEVLTVYHRPARLNGARDLTPTQLRDLVTFLRSL